MSTMTLVLHAILFVLTVIPALVICSEFELQLHWRVMHNMPLGFTYAYEAHNNVHHVEFSSDHTYHSQDPKKAYLIKMALWNAPVLWTVGITPSALLGFFVWYLDWISGPVVLTVNASLLLTYMVYYFVYEYLHWCFHLPLRRKIEMWRWVRKLNAHHALHHKYRWLNLNVVLPWADRWHGTLITRAIKPYPQPGYPVPDVQPLTT